MDKQLPNKNSKIKEELSQNHTENFVEDDPRAALIEKNNNNPHKAKRRSTSTRISREQDPAKTQKNRVTKQYFSNKDKRTRCIIWRDKWVNYCTNSRRQ